MKLLNVKVNIPVDGKDGREIMQTDLTMVMENVYFIVKEPMQTTFQIVGQMPTPLMSSQPINEDLMEEAGFYKFEITNGGTVWANPSHIIFIMNPELGVYNLTFKGGSRVPVKTTGAKITEMFEGTSGNILL